jgi:hypothetical protein
VDLGIGGAATVGHRDARAWDDEAQALALRVKETCGQKALSAAYGRAIDRAVEERGVPVQEEDGEWVVEAAGEDVLPFIKEELRRLLAVH